MSSKARTLSVKAVMRMTDDQAFQTFKELRWPKTDGEPVCPKCGSLTIYELRRARAFKCKDCRSDFSVTSGTIFANRKLPIRDYLAAIALFVRGAKGRAALDLSFSLGVQYKTAFVLFHKLREALGSTLESVELEGEVEIDGAVFGHYVKHRNRKTDRVDLRLPQNQSRTRQFVIAARERGGRVITTIAKSEGEGAPFILNRVDQRAKLYADEGPGWDSLQAYFDMERINHKAEFVNGHIHTNNVESFFSRVRRAQIGTHHSISKGYLDAYAAEMAWRENNRKESDGAQLMMMGMAALGHPVSRKWAGYWQRGPSFRAAA